MSISRPDFVERLCASGLLTRDEVNAFQAALAPDRRSGSASDLAWELVRNKKITEFQAKALYNGSLKRLVFGDYVVLDRIGAGGMGQVFKAVHRRMDRTVALKLLDETASRSPDIVERFRREVKAAARLTHPNIVAAYDAGEIDQILYLVMEFVDGRDLRNLVHELGSLPIWRAVNFVIQAAKGLEHAHSQSIVHRDIKPANLLVDKKGVVKILDMGLARIDEGVDTSGMAGRLTLPGQMLGTVEYISPEQAEDTRKADERSDIYSLGGTLHYLLTGKPPYPRDTIVEALRAHEEAPIPILRSLRADIPPALEGVFQRMMAKKPAERFPSMRELVFELELCDIADPAHPPAASRSRTMHPGRDSTVVGVELAEDSRFSSTSGASAVTRGLPQPLAPEVFEADTVSGEAMDDTGKSAVAEPSRKLSSSSRLMDADRMAAEWALQVRGKVVVRNGEQRVRSSDTTKLPPGAIRVETISLEYNKMVSDDDLGRLQGLTDITRIYLHGTRITDRGLEHLRNATSLVYLSLGKTKISDEGIAHLACLRNLKHLGLYSTQVTDRAIQHLRQLTSLEELIIDETGITPAGIENLKRALPRCRITH